MNNIFKRTLFLGLSLFALSNIACANSPLSISENAFQYSSNYRDNESSLYYLNARYYDPAISRFVQWDSYSQSQKRKLFDQRYNYAVDDSVNNEDPSGHCGGPALAAFLIGDEEAMAITLDAYRSELAVTASKAKESENLFQRWLIKRRVEAQFKVNQEEWMQQYMAQHFPSPKGSTLYNLESPTSSLIANTHNEDITMQAELLAQRHIDYKVNPHKSPLLIDHIQKNAINIRSAAHREVKVLLSTDAHAFLQQDGGLIQFTQLVRNMYDELLSPQFNLENE